MMACNPILNNGFFYVLPWTAHGISWWESHSLLSIQFVVTRELLLKELDWFGLRLHRLKITQYYSLFRFVLRRLEVRVRTGAATGPAENQSRQWELGEEEEERREEWWQTKLNKQKTTDCSSSTALRGSVVSGLSDFKSQTGWLPLGFMLGWGLGISHIRRNVFHSFTFISSTILSSISSEE